MCTWKLIRAGFANPSDSLFPVARSRLCDDPAFRKSRRPHCVRVPFDARRGKKLPMSKCKIRILLRMHIFSELWAFRILGQQSMLFNVSHECCHIYRSQNLRDCINVCSAIKPYRGGRRLNDPRTRWSTLSASRMQNMSGSYEASSLPTIWVSGLLFGRELVHFLVPRWNLPTFCGCLSSSCESDSSSRPFRTRLVCDYPRRQGEWHVSDLSNAKADGRSDRRLSQARPFCLSANFPKSDRIIQLSTPDEPRRPDHELGRFPSVYVRLANWSSFLHWPNGANVETMATHHGWWCW